MKKNYTFEEIVKQIKIKNFGNILFDIANSAANFYSENEDDLRELFGACITWNCEPRIADSFIIIDNFHSYKSEDDFINTIEEDFKKCIANTIVTKGICDEKNFKSLSNITIKEMNINFFNDFETGLKLHFENHLKTQLGDMYPFFKDAITLNVSKIA